MRTCILWTVVGIAAVGLVAQPASASTQARISGQVITASGEPVPDAVITITCGQLPTYNKETATDKKGRYKVLILDATKRYKFHVEKDGFIAHEETVKVRTGSMDNEINFTLRSHDEMAAAQQEQRLLQPGIKELSEANALIGQGNKTGARDKLLEAVAAKPDMVQAWTMLAELDYDLGEYAQAVEHAEKCLELDETATPCVAIAANASNKRGDEKAYQEYMDRYQALNPDDPTTLFNSAVEHLNAMDDEKAKPILERCLEADPTFPKCLFEYGMVLLRLGDLEGAKAQLEKYLEVAPDGEDAETARETVKYL
jgi:tetratricopeptide (TPR) repeat protein